MLGIASVTVMYAAIGTHVVAAAAILPVPASAEIAVAVTAKAVAVLLEKVGRLSCTCHRVVSNGHGNRTCMPLQHVHTQDALSRLQGNNALGMSRLKCTSQSGTSGCLRGLCLRDSA